MLLETPEKEDEEKTMPLLNYTTEIPAEKTVAEVESMLAKTGAEKILKEYASGTVSSISFMIKTSSGTIPIKLPLRLDAVMATINKQIGEYKRDSRGYQRRVVPESMRNNTQQAARVGWRIIKDWLEAQLAVNELEMVKMEEIFLPYIVGRDGKTLFEHVEQKGFQGYLLEAPENDKGDTD